VAIGVRKDFRSLWQPIVEIRTPLESVEARKLKTAERLGMPDRIAVTPLTG